jgi:hypothetical protein
MIFGLLAAKAEAGLAPAIEHPVDEVIGYSVCRRDHLVAFLTFPEATMICVYLFYYCSHPDFTAGRAARPAPLFVFSPYESNHRLNSYLQTRAACRGSTLR